MFSLFKALKKFHPNLSYQEIKTHKSKFDRGLRFPPPQKKNLMKWVIYFRAPKIQRRFVLVSSK